MPDRAGRLGVVIVEYRDPEGASSVVHSFARAPDMGIVVVSTGPVPFPSERGVTVIHLPDNPGFGAAVNRGVREFVGTATHVLVSNTDVLGSLEGVRQLWRVARDRALAIVAPTILGPGGQVEWDGGSIEFGRTRVVHERRGEHPRPESVVQPTMFVTGAYFLLQVEAWEAVGGMREDFFMYAEDADFALRLRRAGLGAAVVTGVRVVHSPSTSVGWLSPLQVYLMTRNNLRLFQEWSPYAWGRWACWVAVPLRLAWHSIAAGGRRWSRCRWICVGLWDARKGSERRLGKGRATDLLPPTAAGA